MADELKIGLVGVGNWGEKHLKKILSISGFSLAGIWDINSSRLKEVAQKYSVNSFSSLEETIADSDAIILTVPTSVHFDLSMKVLLAGKHLFVEKPIVEKTADALKIIELAERKNLVLMVGHIERFNNAFLSVEPLLKKKRLLFVEAHRLAQFSGRCTDVSVVMDLMIHDLELLTYICGNGGHVVDSAFARVASKQPDIASARIHFPSGTVANLTASRFSLSPMRKMRIFLEGAYIVLDFAQGNAEVLQISESESDDNIESIKMGDFYIKRMTIKNEITGDALSRELEYFANCILKKNKYDPIPAVESLRLAEEIISKGEPKCSL